MIRIFMHEAYSEILKKRNLDRPLLPLVEMELEEQEIEELKQTILELDKDNHLETCGREIAMCFAYWFQHEYSGGNETKKSEEVAEFIGLERKKGPDIASYGLNALKAWGWEVAVSKKGKQRILGTLLEQGGTPYNYILQLVEGKEKKRQSGVGQASARRGVGNGDNEVEQARVNYLGFLTALLREAPNYSYDWNKAMENAYDIVCQLEANDRIPESLKTPYLCKQYLLMIRGVVEGNDELKKSLGKGMQDLINKLDKIYNETNKEVRDLSLCWKLRIEQGQILQYYSLINYNLLDPQKLGVEPNNCNSFDLIIGKVRFRYIKDIVDEKILYRHRPQQGDNADVYYDGSQPFVQAQIVLGGQLHTIKLKNDVPINFATPQILKKTSDYYIQSSFVSGTDNVVVFNDEWHCSDTSSELVTYNNEEFHLIHFNNHLMMTNDAGEHYVAKSTSADYNVEIEGADFELIDCHNYILTRNGPHIKVYDVYNNIVDDKCKCVYRVHQSYNERWKTKEEWGILPIGLLDVKIELPNHTQKSYTFYEMGNLMPNYLQADGDTTIINWNTQDYISSSVSIEDTDNECFQIEHQEGAQSQWKLSRKQGVAYRQTCTFHLKANHVSPQIDIQVRTLFKANFITETIDGKYYELENGKVLSYGKIEDYAILVSNDNNQDVPMSISYISKEKSLETKFFTVKCDNKIHNLSDYKDAIDELIENRSHLHGFITADKKLEIKIGENRKYYLRQYVYDIEITGQFIKLSSVPRRQCHLNAIPLFDPVDDCSSDMTTTISPVELIKTNGLYKLPVVNECHRFLVYSSKEDDERAIPVILDTTQNNDKYLRIESKDAIIEAWVKALKEENCSVRGGIWDRCAKYFILAEEESIHFSAFDCINAVASDDLLLAKFVVHMIFVDNGNSKIMEYLRNLEHEFIFSSFWISKFNWIKVNREILLKMMPGAYLKNGHIHFSQVDLHNLDIKKKREEYSQKWQPAIFETRRALFNSAIEKGSFLFQKVIEKFERNVTHEEALSSYPKFWRNIKKLHDMNSIPMREDVQFCLKNNYFDYSNSMIKGDEIQYLMAAMYLAEVLCGMHEEIWKDENYRLRKQILRCQDFQSGLFTELVTDTLDYILKNNLNN